MWGAGEEVKNLNSFEVVMSNERLKVAGLSGGVTGEINNFGWFNGEKFVDNRRVAASARWVENDSGIGRDEIKGLFGFSEISRNFARGGFNFGFGGSGFRWFRISRTVGFGKRNWEGGILRAVGFRGLRD